MKKVAMILVVMVCVSYCFTNYMAPVNAETSFSQTTSALSVAGYYSQYLKNHAEKENSAQEIMLYGKDVSAIKGDAEISSDYPGNTGDTLISKQGSEVTWTISVEHSGLYAMEIRYFPVAGNGGTIERNLRIDGALPFREAEFLTFPRYFTDDVQDNTFDKDYNGNEIKPAQKEVFRWITSEIKDPLGYTSGALQVYLEQGTHTFSLLAVKEHMAIDYIRLYKATDPITYQQLLTEYQQRGYQKAELSLTAIQGEHPIMKSDPSIALISDRSSRYDIPQDAAVNLINTIGSDKWQTVGQSLTWSIDVPQSGLYRIGLRARQNILSGSVSGRKLLIDGKVPFQEASNLLFPYSGDFQKKYLGDEENGDYYFYFEKGTHEITLEVIMSDVVASIVQRVEENLAQLNEIYRSILMITGSSPDLQRDYNFKKMIPEEIETMSELADDFDKLIKELNHFSGTNGESATTLNKIRFQLEIMAKDPKDIAENLETFKTNIGSLGTWLLTAKQQPLEIDYILLAGERETEFTKKESGIKEFFFSIHSFVMSFFNDYEVVGGSEETGKQAVTVWLTSGRDQAQILRQLVDNDFCKNTGIGVNLQLVSTGALLPSVLAGTGPDIALSIAYTDPINYAVRGAVTDLTQCDDYQEVSERFYESALIPFRFNNKVYALPETQTFPMMFYRTDIFETLGISAPKTWDDFYRIIPVLQKNNLEIGFQANLSGLLIFMYQQGISLYQNNGAAVNLDNNNALDCFKQLTELYTKYNFDVSYDFANRFRTGEMPLAIQDYTLYNQLEVFAPEIKGMWDFVPVPGTVDENGNINNSVPSGGTASVILSKAKSKENAWQFLKWWTKADVQGLYARQMEALMGQGAKYATANIEAFQSMSWSTKVYNNIMTQWNSVKGTPEVPGSYYTSRYIDFAFSKVYNYRENPVETMLDYVDEINSELTRKRQEFGLAE